MAPNTETSESTFANEAPAGDGVAVQTPEFQSFVDAGSQPKQQEISRFADIKVTVSAELGRTSIPIERLLSLGKGSVLELDRGVESPIELIAQGIPLASGEVVIVDDCFAIRILEVYPRKRRGEEIKGEKTA